MTNIEGIMQSIREHVLTKQAVVSGEQIPMVMQGKVLPAEFYEHLHQANLGHERIEVQLDIAPANVPVIGGILQMVRRKLHELVVFYVNQTAVKQINVNHHLVRAVSILAEEMEDIAAMQQAE